MIAQHPTATAQDIAAGMTKVGGVDPQTAIKVVSDVFAQKNAPQPNALGPTAPLANQARLATAQGQADSPAPVTPPATAPSAAPSTAASDVAPGVTPPSMPSVPSTPATVPQVPSAAPAQTQPSALTPPANAPAQAQRGGLPAWAQIAQRVLPIGIALAGGRDNPAGAASFLSSYDNAMAAKNARDAQQAQQDKENQFKQQTLTNDQNQFNAKLKIDQQNADTATEKAKTVLSDDQMKKIEAAPDGAAAEALYRSYYPNDEKGLDAVFRDSTGNLKASNPFSNTAAKIDALKTKYGQDTWNKFWTNVNLHSKTPDAQKEIASSYDKQSGTHDFTDALQNGTGPTDKAMNDDAKLAILKQRADTYGDITKARITDITAAAGLKREQGKYIDAKTGEVVPLAQADIKMKQATADYLGARTGEVVPLADAEIAYKGALGDAATANVDSTRERSDAYAKQVAQAAANSTNKEAQALSTKLAKASDDLAKWRANPQNQDDNLKPKPDPPALVDQIKVLEDQINRVNTPAPAPTTDKPTDRSTAWKTGTVISPALKTDTFGGSSPNTVRMGRVLGSMFGITDIGGRANPSGKGTDGHQSDSDHYTGRALDFMTGSDSGKGQKLADYVAANADRLGVKYVIWQRHIFSPARASEGWRQPPNMVDRGSPTANHEDHVHVSFNDNAPAASAGNIGNSRSNPGDDAGWIDTSQPGQAIVHPGTGGMPRAAQVLHGKTPSGDDVTFSMPSNSDEVKALTPYKKVAYVQWLIKNHPMSDSQKNAYTSWIKGMTGR